MQDESKVVMGTTPSSQKDGITSHIADPAEFPAGLVVRLNPDIQLSVDANDGPPYGVSLGQSLTDYNGSDIQRTCVLRSGLRVPVLLKSDPAVAEVKASKTFSGITFTSKLVGAAGNDIRFRFVDDAFNPSESASISGLDITVHVEAGASTLNDAKAALLAVTAITDIVDITGSGVSVVTAIGYTNLEDGVDAEVDHNFVVQGQLAWVDTSTGILGPSGEGEATKGIYVSGPMKGVLDDGSEVDVALVNMIGGL